MNSGVYDEASDDILRLHYLEKRDPTASNVSDANDGDKQVKSRNRSLRIGLFVGIGTLTAVLAGVIFRLTRRMRNNDDQTELQNSAVQTYLDVEEQRPSFS
jgi:chromosome condensin MukBEF MukE localization factor